MLRAPLVIQHSEREGLGKSRGRETLGNLKEVHGEEADPMGGGGPGKDNSTTVLACLLTPPKHPSPFLSLSCPLIPFLSSPVTN